MLLSAMLAAATATVPAIAEKASSPAANLVGVTLDACYPFATGDLKLGLSLADDEKKLADRNISTGLANRTMERVGRPNIDLIAQSLIGERVSGDTTVVLAVGGRMQGCRSILLAPAQADLAEDVAKNFTRLGWNEMDATNAPDAAVTRRMFVKLDAKGQPYLINMFSGTLPESDFRVMTTVNAIPENVQLPKGQ
jgi:hypothetical protein